jgi:hypothetical protein
MHIQLRVVTEIIIDAIPKSLLISNKYKITPIPNNVPSIPVGFNIQADKRLKFGV